MPSRRQKMDKWKRFTRYGDLIPCSPFIPFKVPIENSSINVPIKDNFIFRDIFSIFPNVGLVIDLTATSKYYDPETVIKSGVLYRKIPIRGHGSIPNNRDVQTFNSIVDQYLRHNHNKIIGVHCTHGVNRTGFLICQYMMTRFNMSARKAINLFRVGRHHEIERDNYISALFQLEKELKG